MQWIQSVVQETCTRLPSVHAISAVLATHVCRYDKGRSCGRMLLSQASRCTVLPRTDGTHETQQPTLRNHEKQAVRRPAPAHWGSEK